MTTAYDAGPGRERQPVGDATVGGVALLVTIAAWGGASGRPSAMAGSAILAALAGWWVARRHGSVVAVVIVVLVVGAAFASAWQWRSARPSQLGPFRGWVTVVDDPVQMFGATRVTLEVDGERFGVFAFGSSGRRLARLQAGDVVRIAGERTELSGPHPRRSLVRHVIGEIDVDEVGDVAVGAPVARASNRVRGLLRAGAESVMGADDAALFTGLVIGDDTRQSPAVVDQFRAAGLSHLTAVSGQNVAFTLAVAGLVLRRLARWWRLGATIGVIAWFAVLTRLEPSVLRAAMMAGVSAIGFAFGYERSPRRILAIAMIVLVLVDPFLVWSVAFWLSTGATFGVTVIAPLLEPRLRGPTWLVPALAVTIGAQVGVLVPSWLVFGRMPALGLFANLLAVPVAGTVMLIGIPAGLLAAMVPTVVAQVVMAPASVGTRWIAMVARLSATFQPSGAAAAVVWGLQAIALLALWRRGPNTMHD